MQRKEHRMRSTRPGVRFRRWRKVGRSGLALLTALLLAATFLPLTAAAAPSQSVGGAVGGEEWARVYTVRPMDTLDAIALRFGVSSEALMRINGLRNPNVIYVGQQLIIPEQNKPGGPSVGGPQCAEYYVVRRGDTLSAIALRYGMDAYDLARANGLFDLNDIYVGQRLCVSGSKGVGGPVKDTPVQPQHPPVKPDPAPKQPDRRGSQQGDGPVRPDDWGRDEHRGGPSMPSGPTRPDDRKPDERKPEERKPDGHGPEGRGPDQKGPHGGSDAYWKGSYFADKYFSEFVEERKDLEIRFNWFTGGPFNNMPQDRFSVRWEKVEYFKAGHYRFFAVADDGVRVYVDDQLIIDGWKIQPATEYKADLFLHEGRHKLVVEYYEEAEDAQIHVYWEPVRK